MRLFRQLHFCIGRNFYNFPHYHSLLQPIESKIACGNEPLCSGTHKPKSSIPRKNKRGRIILACTHSVVCLQLLRLPNDIDGWKIPAALHDVTGWMHASKNNACPLVLPWYSSTYTRCCFFWQLKTWSVQILHQIMLEMFYSISPEFIVQNHRYYERSRLKDKA